MARYRRIESESKIYHIMCRAHNKQILFGDESDYLKFLSILKKAKDEFEFKVFAYCLMPNHLHLIIFDINKKLSFFMKKINTEYAIYSNLRYERIGSVFNNRFRSENIENKKYLLTCIRYIHQNPVKAGICKKIFEYKFSSIHAYKDKKGNYLSLVDPDFLLSKISIKDFLDWNILENDDKCLDVEEKKFFDKNTLSFLSKKYKIESLIDLQNLSEEEKKKITIELLNRNFSIRKISRLVGFYYKKIIRIKNGIEEKPINAVYKA